MSRIDTSPQRFERDFAQKPTPNLLRLKQIGEECKRTGTMTHQLIVAELKRRGIEG